jgi:hypothetical protein
MPAETIHGDHLPVSTRIAWGAGGGYIQVSTPHDNGEAPPAGSTTWCATFDDRAAVNRMIAVLRRARDHAFGKDE